jgi:hypothetical protein
MRASTVLVAWGIGAIGCGQPRSVHVASSVGRAESVARQREGDAPAKADERRELRPSELTPEPPDDGSSVPLQKLLNPDLYRTRPEPARGLVVTTRGGSARLNAMGDALRRAAAECHCTDRIVDLESSSRSDAAELLATLGLMQQAGFTRARVTIDGVAITFALALNDVPKAGDRVLRLVEPHLAWFGEKGYYSDISQACGGSRCEGASLSVAAYGGVESLWQAAQSVRAADAPVRLLLDRLPRSPRRVTLRGKVTTMLPDFVPGDARDSVVADYGQLYRCLVEYPPPDAAPPLQLVMKVGADGAILSLRMSGKAAASETASCVRDVFGRMAFRAPNFGTPADLFYSFALDTGS